jgi:hypothetical protein
MERAYRLLILMAFLFSFVRSEASRKTEIYQAYISNNMPKWEQIIDRMNAQKDKDPAFLLESVNYMYGYIAWCIGNNRHDTAEKYLALAEKYLNQLEGKSYELSMIDAYRSAFYGYRIGLNKLKAPFIGGKSISCANLAVSLDASNPFGYIQLGNSQFYMPAIFGGSKTKALDYYLIAVGLMEKESGGLKEDWNYLNLLTRIGQAYDAVGDNYMARQTFEKLLKIEPGYLFVKDELYPEILKKVN